MVWREHNPRKFQIDTGIDYLDLAFRDRIEYCIILNASDVSAIVLDLYHQ